MDEHWSNRDHGRSSPSPAAPDTQVIAKLDRPLQKRPRFGLSNELEHLGQMIGEDVTGIDCGKQAWNHAPRSPIRAGDVLGAEALVLAELDEEFFHVRFEKATAREREYMAAMADLGEGLRARHRQGASSATLRGAEQISGERRPRDPARSRGVARCASFLRR